MLLKLIQQLLSKYFNSTLQSNVFNQIICAVIIPYLYDFLFSSIINSIILPILAFYYFRAAVKFARHDPSVGPAPLKSYYADRIGTTLSAVFVGGVAQKSAQASISWRRFSRTSLRA